MKTILLGIIFTFSSGAFAAGSTTGGKPSLDSKIQISNEIPSQVYYMGESETEVQFATNIKGSPEVVVKSATIEDLQKFEEIVDSLRKSQQHQKWIEVKPEANTENNGEVKWFNDNNRLFDIRSNPQIELNGGSLKGFDGGSLGGAIRGGGFGR